MRTQEGVAAYSDAINPLVDFFSKAGSLLEKKQSFYNGEAKALDLFKPAYDQDPITAFKLVLWLRDCRGGAGNRSGARSILTWLAENHPQWIQLNMHLIPVYGRWDDLVSLFTTPLRNQAGAFWADAINGGDVLAAKWAKRHHKPTREALGLKESEFRKLLSSLRKDHIVEHLMCQQKWNEIQYSKVPSVAMARYTRAFANRDPEGFQRYKNAITKGEATVHADVLFPHDCIRTSLYGDTEIAEAQFNALPNYLEGTDERIMVISDSSGSMRVNVSGSVTAMHVSMGMALYCSSRFPEDSPFFKRFITFCSESSLVDWRKYGFNDAIRSRNIFNGAVGSTRIDKAMRLILSLAKERNIPQRLMPSTLLIVSDMQFTQGATSGGGWNTHNQSEDKALTEIHKAMIGFDNAGYQRPKVVYWNTAGYSGQQDTVNSNDVGMISGFSPAILKSVFTGKDFSPYGIMIEALNKYEIEIPRRSE